MGVSWTQSPGQFIKKCPRLISHSSTLSTEFNLKAALWGELGLLVVRGPFMEPTPDPGAEPVAHPRTCPAAVPRQVLRAPVLHGTGATALSAPDPSLVRRSGLFERRGVYQPGRLTRAREVHWPCNLGAVGRCENLLLVSLTPQLEIWRCTREGFNSTGPSGAARRGVKFG